MIELTGAKEEIPVDGVQAVYFSPHTIHPAKFNGWDIVLAFMSGGQEVKVFELRVHQGELVPSDPKDPESAAVSKDYFDRVLPDMTIERGVNQDGVFEAFEAAKANSSATNEIDRMKDAMIAIGMLPASKTPVARPEPAREVKKTVVREEVGPAVAEAIEARGR